jgi:hypothetical protein
LQSSFRHQIPSSFFLQLLTGNIPEIMRKSLWSSKAFKGHFRVANERDVLRRFAGKSPHIRPLLDEIIDPSEPTAIVLRHLQNHLWQASGEKTLNRKELKYVSRRVLEALQVMHAEGFVHAGMMAIPN